MKNMLFLFYIFAVLSVIISWGVIIATSPPTYTSSSSYGICTGQLRFGYEGMDPEYVDLASYWCDTSNVSNGSQMTSEEVKK